MTQFMKTHPKTAKILFFVGVTIFALLFGAWDFFFSGFPLLFEYLFKILHMIGIGVLFSFFMLYIDEEKNRVLKVFFWLFFIFMLKDFVVSFATYFVYYGELTSSLSYAFLEVLIYRFLSYYFPVQLLIWFSWLIHMWKRKQNMGDVHYLDFSSSYSKSILLMSVLVLVNLLCYVISSFISIGIENYWMLKTSEWILFFFDVGFSFVLSFVLMTFTYLSSKYISKHFL